jgi:AraC-like DNA-binding protein
MFYQEQLPLPPLRPYVERYFRIEFDLPPGQVITQPVSPAGTSQIAFNLGTANVMKNLISQEFDQPYRGCLVGQFTRKHDYRLHGHFQTVVIHFTPTGFYSLFGVPAHYLSDQATELEALLGSRSSQLLERLQNTPSFSGQAAVLDEYLTNQLSRSRALRPEIVGALQKIRHRHGNLSIKDLAEELNFTQRSLERHFAESVGVTPKMYARITRFFAVRQAIEQGHYRSWHDIIHRAGFYDQSHFIREFSLFTGRAPSEYFSRYPAIENLFLETRLSKIYNPLSG